MTLTRCSGRPRERRASEAGLRALQSFDVQKAGIDAVLTTKTANSIEKIDLLITNQSQVSKCSISECFSIGTLQIAADGCIALHPRRIRIDPFSVRGFVAHLVDTIPAAMARTRRRRV